MRLNDDKMGKDKIETINVSSRAFASIGETSSVWGLCAKQISSVIALRKFLDEWEDVLICFLEASLEYVTNSHDNALVIMERLVAMTWNLYLRTIAGRQTYFYSTPYILGCNLGWTVYSLAVTSLSVALRKRCKKRLPMSCSWWSTLQHCTSRCRSA